MSDIWRFTPWLPDEPGLDRLGEYCSFTNAGSYPTCGA
jgi:hypothetical protein